MFNFGEYSVVKNGRHTFEKMPDWWWEFRVPNPVDEIVMAKFYQEESNVVTVDGKEFRYPPVWTKVMVKELSLLFTATNITDDSGEFVLKENAPVAEVEKVLKMMPEVMVEEIWTSLNSNFPNWGPRPVKSQDGTGQAQTEESGT